MKLRVLSIIAGCLILIGCNSSNSEVDQAAAQAAEQWLSVVDSGLYEDSWVETAPLFQSQVSKTKWAEMLASVRQPLGSKLSRSLVKTEYAPTLPGVPDGEYVVSTFDSSFEQKVKAVEIVTVGLSEDGEWEVLGYFIK